MLQLDKVKCLQPRTSQLKLIGYHNYECSTKRVVATSPTRLCPLRTEQRQHTVVHTQPCIGAVT